MKNFYVKKIEDVISEKELPQAILSFGMERKNEVLLISNKKKQLESAAVTILLQELLMESGYQKDEIIKDEKGAPKLKKQKNIFCSLSHSKEYVSCAISDQAIGIDIQEMREGKRERISKRFFHKKEQELCNQNTSIELFYKIWTSKESYVKMLGSGLAGNMDSFYLDMEKESICSCDGKQLASVSFKSYDSYMLCITTEDK